MRKASAYQCWLYLHSGLKLAGTLSWQPAGYKSPILSSDANSGKTKKGPSAVLSGYAFDNNNTLFLPLPLLYILGNFKYKSRLILDQDKYLRA